MNNDHLEQPALSRREALVLGLTAVLGSQTSSSAQAATTDNPAHKMTKEDVDRWMTELSNWGRWGKDDELGTLNLITPAKRKEAAGLVKEGYPVSLAHDILKDKADDNFNPFNQTVQPRPKNFNGTGFGGDTYSVSYHGFAHTHMDALWHANYQGKMYNGYSIDTITPEGGQKDSILVAKK